MIVFILFVAAFFRLIFLNQSFWLDEAAQAVLSNKNLFDVNWGADFQPPFFYVLTHFWQSFGIKEEWFLRLPSVFFGVSTVCLTYFFFKKLFNEKFGLVVALFLATSPYHIYYSQEYRMYSFFLFLTVLSWLFLWERRWRLYGIIILAAVFTHYFAFLLIFSQFIFVFISQRGERNRYLKTTVISLFPFLLWLPTFINQMQTASNLISVWPDWTKVSGVPFLKFPFLLLAKFTVGVTSPMRVMYGLTVGIVGMIFLLITAAILNEIRSGKLEAGKKKDQYYLLLCYFSIPVIIAWISGLWISINGPWRLLFVLPAFYAIIAVGTEVILAKAGYSPVFGRGIYLNRFRVKPGMTIATVLLASNIVFYSYYLFFPKNHRENWKDAVAYTDSRVGDNGLVLTEYIGPWAPMEWYSKYPNQYTGASLSLPITEKSIDRRFNNVTMKQSENIILYTYLFQLSDPSRFVEQYLGSKGYKLTEEKDFRGVGILKIYSR